MFYLHVCISYIFFPLEHPQKHRQNKQKKMYKKHNEFTKSLGILVNEWYFIEP